MNSGDNNIEKTKTKNVASADHSTTRSKAITAAKTVTVTTSADEAIRATTGASNTARVSPTILACRPDRLGGRLLGREVAVRSGIPSERVLGPLLLARRTLEQEAVGEREMLVRVRALAGLEVEVLGGD